MAEAEVIILKDKIPIEKERLQLLLLPKDKDDSRNAILEVRAGQAVMRQRCLGPIYLVCTRFAAKNSWRFEVMAVSETDRRLQGSHCYHFWH